MANALSPSPRQPPSAALTAPTPLRDALSTLRELMAVYTSSLLLDDSLSSAPSVSQSSLEFAPVLSAALDPALEMCAKMREMRQSEWDRAVFGVNCWEACLGALEGFGFTATRCRELEEGESRDVETLTGEHVGPGIDRGEATVADSLVYLQFTHLLKDSGLEPILTALHGKDTSVRFPSLSLSLSLPLTLSFHRPLSPISPLPLPPPSKQASQSSPPSSPPPTLSPPLGSRCSLPGSQLPSIVRRWIGSAGRMRRFGMRSWMSLIGTRRGGRC